jgi:hypothetical protein
MEDARIGDVEIHKAGVESASRGRTVDDAAKGHAQEVIDSENAKYQDIRAEAKSRCKQREIKLVKALSVGNSALRRPRIKVAQRASEDLAIVCE